MFNVGNFKVITPPATQPVTLGEAKDHCRAALAFTGDDVGIANTIKAATARAETYLRRALVTQTLEYIRDRWPEDMLLYLPRPLLQSVTSIKYRDAAGAETTWAPANYIVDADSEPGRIALADGITWPAVTLQRIAGIRIRYLAGYGAADSVPEDIKFAILLTVGDFYNNREDSALPPEDAKLIPAARALLNPYRVRWLDDE